MEIKVGFEITYAAVQATPMVTMLSLHPSRYSDTAATASTTPKPIAGGSDVAIGFYRDSFGNVCGRLVAPAGGVTLKGHALGRDSRLPVGVNPGAPEIADDQ